MTQKIDKIIVGLDIGSTKICVVVARKDEYGKIEILGMGKANSDGVTRGVVTNIDKTVTAIKKAKDEAEEQSGINIRVVNVGIAGQHIKSFSQHGSITRPNGTKEISVDDVTRLTNDMYKIMNEPGMEIIHVMAQDYTIDGEINIKEPIGMLGVKLEADFHIITAATGSLGNIKKCLDRAGLVIDNIILEPIASGMSVLSDEERKYGVVLVDIGGGTTDIAIFHENIIRHTAVIPFGGAVITSDIQQGCMVMDSQAELLKVRYGKAIAEEADPNEIVSIPSLHNRAPKEISVTNLSKIIEARIGEIIEEVHKEILRSKYSQKLLGGIVVTGGGSMLTGLNNLFALMTGMDIRTGIPTEHLNKNNINFVKHPSYATPVGLVMAGFYAIDYRNEQAQSEKDTNVNKQYKGTTEEKAKTPETEAKPISFFQKVIDRTKKLLMDDFDEDGEKKSY
jgi:cell division protein FtsA